MRRAYHHGDLERALVAAGLELVRVGGVEAAGLRAAARAVGVSHAAPMRHFPDARSFVAALAAEAYRELAETLEAASATTTDPIQRLRAVGLAYVRFAVEHTAVFRLLSHPAAAGGRPAMLEEASMRAYDAVRGAIVTAQDVGALNSQDPDRLALAAWSMVHGAATLLIDDQLTAKGYDLSVDDAAELVTSILFVGLRPESS